MPSLENASNEDLKYSIKGELEYKLKKVMLLLRTTSQNTIHFNNFFLCVFFLSKSIFFYLQFHSLTFSLLEIGHYNLLWYTLYVVSSV